MADKEHKGPPLSFFAKLGNVDGFEAVLDSFEFNEKEFLEAINVTKNDDIKDILAEEILDNLDLDDLYDIAAYIIDKDSVGLLDFMSRNSLGDDLATFHEELLEAAMDNPKAKMSKDILKEAGREVESVLDAAEKSIDPKLRQEALKIGEALKESGVKMDVPVATKIGSLPKIKPKTEGKAR